MKADRISLLLVLGMVVLLQLSCGVSGSTNEITVREWNREVCEANGGVWHTAAPGWCELPGDPPAQSATLTSAPAQPAMDASAFEETEVLIPDAATEESIPSCDATAFIRIGQGEKNYYDEGWGTACVVEAPFTNLHSELAIWVITHLTDGRHAQLKVPALAERYTAFSLRGEHEAYNVDWVVAFYDTPECVSFYTDMPIEQMPSNGLWAQDISVDNCSP
jgi:hypothetical protein